MFQLESLMTVPPFSLNKEEKRALYREALGDLIRHHYAHCVGYRRILDALGVSPKAKLDPEQMPFLPVRLFKRQVLSSVAAADVVRTLSSSGTSGASVSKILLDRETASDQTKVLVRIVTDFIGKKRLPMLVIDSRSALSTGQFSARAAGILGFSVFGRDVTYALKEDGQPDFEMIRAFLARHRGEPTLLFGLTYLVWERFLKPLTENGEKFSFEGAVLVHGGGWKKVQDRAVDNESFKQGLKRGLGIGRVHNYYGMVEQTGSIFMECEKGFLHSSIFSDVLIRDSQFALCEKKVPGTVELLSLLPRSYPGHILLSEDVGEIDGEDDCACGRKGKYFRVHGRVEQAETRGCSDSLAA